MPDSEHDHVCFHCQQCAEKYLKALMEECGVVIPRIHDLDRLSNSLPSFQPSLRSLRRGLLVLTSFAVEFRYPGENATCRQAQAAIRWIERIRPAARALLGIHEARPGK